MPSHSHCAKRAFCVTRHTVNQSLHLHTLYTHQAIMLELFRLHQPNFENPAAGMTKPHNLMPILAAGIAHRPCLRLVL